MKKTKRKRHIWYFEKMLIKRYMEVGTRMGCYCMSKRIRILVVDDELMMRESLKLILSKYEVIDACDGVEAVNICKHIKPDIILMDVMMPRMNGIEATKKILKMHPDIKIIAVTAYATSKGKEMLEAGAVTILEKPFRRQKLEELIESLIEDGDD
jgi:CheY-like chemotaxis protein